ncbi:helix-turn-helix domain-containing protein [Glutamicibacter arilaitensis]|uniref:helix-turn-helix domain-containing protein n=1 Tax=Glutamicibacter arilaitensis TaxID=256701 RepID=UPI003F904FE4
MSLVVEFIDEFKNNYGIEPIIRALEDTSAQTAVSSYCAHKTRPKSKRAIRDEKLVPLMCAAFEENYSCYGARKMWHSMNREHSKDLGPWLARFASQTDRPDPDPIALLTFSEHAGEAGIRSPREAAMSRPVKVRTIDDDEQARLLQIVRRGGNSSVVTWRRAQMVLLSTRGLDVVAISEVVFTSPDRVRDVLHHFTTDGFDSLHPHYAGGRPPKFTAGQREKIKNIALERPADHGLPFSTWSLSKLADYLVAQGVVDGISPEGLRMLLRAEDVSFPVPQDVEGQHGSELRGQSVCDRIKVGHFSIKSRPLQRPNSGRFSRRYGPVKPQGSWPLMITPEDKTNHHTPQRSTPVEPLKEINSPGGERKRDMGPSCFTINS